MMGISLRHFGCRGFYQPWVTQGRMQFFRCEKCHHEIFATKADDDSRQREEVKRKKWLTSLAAIPPTPPPQPVRALTEREWLILQAYRNWSEENFSTGFHSPFPDIVDSFVADMRRGQLFDGYEEDMLREFARSTGE